MLTHIHIQNFMIVETLNLDFDNGFNVLTGETGAGKSIWIDAVGLALGNRADSKCIRHGKDRCEISLCFDIQDNPTALNWLKENELEADTDCIIRRTINRNGNSRITINGSPCTAGLLKQFSNQVISIHGQHQQQTLLKRDAQRERLDLYAHNKPLLNKIQTIYVEHHSTQKQLDTLKAQVTNRDAELSLLRYQFEELEKAAVETGEWEKLSREHQKLHNAKSLIGTLNQAIDIAVESEDSSATLALENAIHQLNSIKEPEPQIESAKEMLNTALIHLQEAGNELHQYRNHLDLSPENLSAIEARLTLIHDLARKHHVNPENLPEVHQSLEQKIADLENIDIEIEALEKQQAKLLEKYTVEAKKLTKSRASAAKTLNTIISKHIQALGIENGRFHIELSPITDKLSAHGNESVQFLVSTNAGHELGPMAKIVSGGELSRISLALQVVTAEKDDTPSLIFDEVDVGIGGKTAETVGKLLRELGEKTQVLCITHLPQVAAQGHHHFRVTKSTQNNETQTEIEQLSEETRIDELARMLGGATITKQTRAHASEMLSV